MLFHGRVGDIYSHRVISFSDTPTAHYLQTGAVAENDTSLTLRLRILILRLIFIDCLTVLLICRELQEAEISARPDTDRL